jgi:cytochrome P450
MSAYRFPPIVPRGPTFLKAARFIHNPIPILDEHVQKYGGTYTFFMGGMRKSIVTADPEFVNHILQKNHRAYEKSALQTDILSQYIGHGLLTAKGDYWLRQRRLIQPGFHKQRLEGLTKLMVDEANEYFDQIAHRVGTKGMEVDIYTEMNILTFRIIAKTLFSTSLKEDRLQRLRWLIEHVQSFIIREVRQPFLHWWFILSGQIKKHIKLAHQSFDIIGEMVDFRKKDDGRYSDLLNMLLGARYEDTGEGMSRQQLIEEALILFTAGHETSANALSWAVSLLAQHPNIAVRIDDEIQHVLGEREIVTADLNQLMYTRQVIEETMRLYPPAWVTDRVSLVDDSFGDFDVPAGTLYILYLYGLHRSPKYWENPDQFQPDRFSVKKKDTFPKLAYKPFGAGPRLCIGNHFAMMEMQVILAEFYRRFQVELLVEPEMAPMITLRPRDGVRVRLRNK